MIAIYISIVVILTITVIHIGYTYAHWLKFEQLRAKVTENSLLLEKIASKKMNLLDLEEFNKLDGYMKDAYKKYIVDTAMAKVMLAVNKQGSDMSLEEYIKNNDAAITQMIDEMFKMVEATLAAKTSSSSSPDSLSPTTMDPVESQNQPRPPLM
jgi:Tfp pilus assembly protein PilO